MLRESRDEMAMAFHRSQTIPLRGCSREAEAEAEASKVRGQAEGDEIDGWFVELTPGSEEVT